MANRLTTHRHPRPTAPLPLQWRVGVRQPKTAAFALWTKTHSQVYICCCLMPLTDRGCIFVRPNQLYLRFTFCLLYLTHPYCAIRSSSLVHHEVLHAVGSGCPCSATLRSPDIQQLQPVEQYVLNQVD